jgi:S-DNA-T family DNA segregation ATPase FtsK/SpoIIIE
MATTKKKTSSKQDPATQLKTEKEKDFSVKLVAKDERTHKISGFLLLLLSLLLFLAIFSYCFTWKQDQDKVFKAGANFLFAENINVDNMLGRLGAWVSHKMVFGGFGIASFIFCCLPFAWGLNLVFGKRVFRLNRTLVYVIISVVYCSLVLAFATTGNDFSFGGAVGEMCSEYLKRLLGSAGTALLLVVIAGAYGIWKFNPQFNLPERKTKPAPVPVTPGAPEEEEEIAPPAVKTSNEEIATQEETFYPSNAKSINELYAIGKFSQLSLQDDSNPLDHQQVSGGENRLTADAEISVIMPKQAVVADPMTTFNLSEEVDTPVTKTTPKPVPFEIKTPKNVEDEWLADTPETDISVVMPERAADQLPLVEKQQESRIKKPELVAVPELEIKPPADIENDADDEFEVNSNRAGTVLAPYDPVLDLRDYKYPNLELLDLHGSEKIVTDASELEDNKNQIINTLKNYDISIQRISATVGPTVTLYEIVPAPGVRISRIKNLEDDIALSLAALGIRIIAPIPGKGTIGIEVPNVRKSIVSMRTLLGSEKFINSPFTLPIAIGKKIDNEHLIVDLASMPHLLMAGATGQGKSVGINAILVSLLYKKHPSQLKFILVDPKKVELSIYRLIEKHFLAKLPGEEEAIITDTKKVVHTLNALCIEMDNRYDLLKEAGVRNIKEYNEKFARRKLNPQKGHQFLPFIVLVVDEFADLIMTAGKEIEMPIARLAQLARAVGIHLIIATQRPSVNIITGTIKAKTAVLY